MMRVDLEYNRHVVSGKKILRVDSFSFGSLAYNGGGGVLCFHLLLRGGRLLDMFIDIVLSPLDCRAVVG